MPVGLAQELLYGSKLTADERGWTQIPIPASAFICVNLRLLRLSAEFFLIHLYSTWPAVRINWPNSESRRFFLGLELPRSRQSVVQNGASNLARGCGVAIGERGVSGEVLEAMRGSPNVRARPRRPLRRGTTACARGLPVARARCSFMGIAPGPSLEGEQSHCSSPLL
jgi:hypothetical protein